MSTPAEGAFTGSVVHRENLGADIFLHLALADGAHRLTVRATLAEADGIAIGATVHAAPLAGRAMAFAPAGARLRFADAPSGTARSRSRAQAVV